MYNTLNPLKATVKTGCYNCTKSDMYS